jgi:plastocyanin
MRLRRSLPALAVAVAVLALAFAGCGGNSDAGLTTGPAADPGAKNLPQSDQAGTKVSMKDIAFKPQSTKLKVGETVTWINEDAVDHDVTATSGATFKSELFGKGKTYAYKATKAGTIKYVCTVHPGMEGTLTVTAK